MIKAETWNLKPRDLVQLIELVEMFSAGAIYSPLDCRKYSKALIRFATEFYLLERRDNRRVYISRDARSFNVYDHLPIETLWALIEKHILTGDHHGYSVVNSKGWHALGIWPLNDKNGFDQTDEMMRIFNTLMTYHFIWFQAGGTIWDIAKRKDAR